jgi:hypothetical protein
MLLTAAAVGALGMVAFAGSAQAQCWWTGLGYSCAAPPAMVLPQTAFYSDPFVYPTPYPAWNSWDYQDYRLRPSWLPSYPGPSPD